MTNPAPDVGWDAKLALESSTPKLILISTHPEDKFADLIAESPALGFIAKAELSPATLGGLLSDT